MKSGRQSNEMRNFALVLIIITSWACNTSTGALAEGPRPVNPNKPQTEKSNYATGLKCPKGNSDVLDFSMRTPAGASTRIWVDYSGDLPVRIKMVVTPAGHPAETTIDVGLDVAMDEKARNIIRAIRTHTDQLYSKTCLADVGARRGRVLLDQHALERRQIVRVERHRGISCSVRPAWSGPPKGAIQS